MRKKRAVFLDRDGTILNERGYLRDPKKIRFYPSALTGLRRLSQAGFLLVVVTNQSGVGRQYFSETRLSEIHRSFTRRLLSKGIRLAGIYHCPHLPDAGCRCRKPAPGMIRRAARELRIDPCASFVVGDQRGDIELAQGVGARSVLVRTGAGRSASPQVMRRASKISLNLDTASRWIIQCA